MANITSNLLNTTIPVIDLGTVQTSLAGISTTLGGVLRALTDDERASLFSLDENNKVFVEEALNEITTNGALLPSAVSATFLASDLELFNQLDGLESQVENLLTRIKDTKRLAGHESYAMSLTIYTLYKSLAAVGVAGAQQSADRLGERFQQQGGGGSPAATNPTSPAIPAPTPN